MPPSRINRKTHPHPQPLSPSDRMFADPSVRPSSLHQRSNFTKPSTPPQRQGSLVSLSGAGIPDAPSNHTIDNDEPFENSSPQRTINDIISVFTAGAGPSVQLVERMSAAVRRLELENANTKGEVARLQAQRNEAREDVVPFVREVEEQKKLGRKVEGLEKGLKEMEGRYESAWSSWRGMWRI